MSDQPSKAPPASQQPSPDLGGKTDRLGIGIDKIELPAHFREYLRALNCLTVDRALDHVEFMIDCERATLWMLGLGNRIRPFTLKLPGGEVICERLDEIPPDYVPRMAVNCFELRDLLRDAFRQPPVNAHDPCS